MYGAGVVTSSDGGLSWTDRTPIPFTSSQEWIAVAMSSDGMTVFAVAGGRRIYGVLIPGGGGIWSSANGGVTWTNWTADPVFSSIDQMWFALSCSADGSRAAMAAQTGGGYAYF